MDTVGYRLTDLIPKLDAKNVRYVVIPTRPAKKDACIEESCRYVIRQTLDDKGIYNLVVAGKMGMVSER